MHTAYWNELLTFLSHSLDSTRFATWIKPLKVVENDNPNILTLSAQNTFSSEFLELHYKNILLSAAKALSLKIDDIIFTVSQESVPSEPKPNFLANSDSPKKIDSSEYPQLNKRFTFNSFIVGPNNEFARSAALAVAESPGRTKFNPLLIYGGVGLGKTHLLQAIGNFMLSNNPASLVTYTTSEEFYLNFIDAIKNNNTKKFTSLFRLSDILLMDDVQFFSGKESTQEEFFYIFNTLYQNGKQIVLTSDFPPNAMKGLQDRLISRFQWGLCVDIQPPDLETRVAILKKKAEEDNLNIPQDILYYIGENVSSNIRELEGVIIRLLAFASITKNDVTIDLVKSVLKISTKKEITKFSIDDIIEKVAEYYNVPVNNIREKNRRKEVAHCRQVAMYVAKTLTSCSLKTIGLNFGGRDHSTVIHAINTIDSQKQTDSILARDIDSIIESLKT